MRNIDISKEQLVDNPGLLHRHMAELKKLEARAVGADDFLGKASDFSNMRNAIKELA